MGRKVKIWFALDAITTFFMAKLERNAHHLAKSTIYTTPTYKPSAQCNNNPFIVYNVYITALIHFG